MRVRVSHLLRGEVLLAHVHIDAQQTLELDIRRLARAIAGLREVTRGGNG